VTRVAIVSAFLLVLAAPFASEAQPSEKIPPVGLLALFPRSAVTPWHQTFRLSLGDTTSLGRVPTQLHLEVEGWFVRSSGQPAHDGHRIMFGQEIDVS
jgi:hypothetical protein